MVEAFGAAEEGIGHVLRPRLGSKIEEAAHLVPRAGRRELRELPEIVFVHGEEKVEAGEIAVLHLPRALARNVDTATARRFLRAAVRRLPDMPMAEAGRVDVEEIEHALFLGDAAEDAFGHRRAADIAETDEEKPVSCHAGSNGMRPAAPQDAAASQATLARPPRRPYFRLSGCSSCEVRTMVAWNEASDLKHAALGREISLAAFAEKERKVRRDFWAKLKRFAGMVPFVEDLVAAYYCALDPATPMRVRGMLLAAIAYFILPFDFIPDVILGLGFADDAALLTAVIGLVAAHITPTHRAAAARALNKELPRSS